MPFPRLPSRQAVLLTIAGFFALTLAVYGHGLTHDFVRWDDGMLVYENPAIREISPKSLAYIFTHYDPELYIPLTFLTYQIDWQIGGQDAFVYHLGNLIWHTLNALLTAWLVFLLSRRQWMGLLAGLLFAVHPLHTEAVEWVSARKDVLSTFFFLGSIIAYMYWREDGVRKMLIVSLAAFVLGLMSKVMVITLPIILLLIDWYEGRKWSRAMMTEKIPYLGIAIVFGLIAIGGKTGVISSSTLPQKILMACKSAVFYLQKILWPTDLSLLYPYIKPITLFSPDFLIPIGVLVALTVFALWSLRWGRGVVLGLLFYIVTVAPTFINFAKGGELDVYFASDRYAYIPSIGIFFAMLLLAEKAASVFTSSFVRTNEQTKKHIPVIIGGALVVVLAFLANRQSLVWKDTESLFRNVIARYPDSSHVAHNNLGNAYRLRGELTQAIAELKQGIAIKPTAKAMSNLGAVFRKQGNLALAHAEYARALALSPQSKEAQLGLGLVYMAERRYPEAKAAFTKAAAIDPRYEEAHTNLGAVLATTGDLEGAVDAYRAALAINPYFADAQFNLAVALEGLGRTDEAIRAYEDTVRMVPHFIPARLSLGVLYARLGMVDDARGQFKAVLRLDPAHAGAKRALDQLGAR